MYPKFRGLWYLVGREFRTSRRPLNVASVRARTVEQATKYQSPRNDGTKYAPPLGTTSHVKEQPWQASHKH